MCYHPRHHLYHVNSLFSDSKQIATDRCACLGLKGFEQLVIMRSAWGPDLYDMTASNASQVEEVTLFDFVELLADDAGCSACQWEKETEAANIEIVV